MFATTSASFQRPPKPTPQAFGRRLHSHDDVVVKHEEKKTEEAEVVIWEEMDMSERSRRSLRREIEKRRRTLTAQESSFLEELCVKGNEIEVQVATETLMDESIFFAADFGMDDSANTWRSEPYKLRTLTSEVSIASLPENCGLPQVAFDSSGSLSNLGSERRQERLQWRRESQVFGQIWKAHQNGLAVSQNGSRRSLLKKYNSLIFGSKRHMERNDQIFRRSGRSPVPMNDNKSDNTRLRRSSFKGKPQLRRLQSEGCGRSKSVTFGEMPKFRPETERVTSEGNIGDISPFRTATRFRSESLGSLPSLDLHKAAPVRSESIGSIPSIHHAHHIKSPASSTVASFPSLHQASHIKSPASSTVLSIPSLHHGHTINSEVAPVLADEWELDVEDEDKRDPSDTEESRVAWEAPIPSKVVLFPNKNIEPSIKLLVHPEPLGRPVLMRKASCNVYQGEGIEVADAPTARALQKEPISTARRFDSMLSFGESSAISTSNSFDESVSYDRLSAIFRRSIPHSLSDDELNGIYLGGSRLLMRETSSQRELKPIESNSSWKMEDDSELDYYDPWKVIEDEYDNGYGGGGTFPFFILGTSADDIESQPHVLSPPLMESLQEFLPFSKMSENFWMKYSLVRDGASLHTFLQKARGAKYSILAVETVGGEVFGAFTSEPWRKNWNYFGGGESFLWRMRHTRKEKTHSIIDQARMESEIDVYPYTGANNSIQLCTHDRLGIGGGNGDEAYEDTVFQDGKPIKAHQWGFGLTIDSDMLHGTTSPCVTFSSPSLSIEHADGSVFEIINLELWTLTPCIRLEEAEKLELGALFLEKHRRE
jgi:hypothetical protein